MTDLVDAVEEQIISAFERREAARAISTFDLQLAARSVLTEYAVVRSKMARTTVKLSDLDDAVIELHEALLGADL